MLVRAGEFDRYSCCANGFDGCFYDDCMCECVGCTRDEKLLIPEGVKVGIRNILKLIDNLPESKSNE
jgi:hypothetical protein